MALFCVSVVVFWLCVGVLLLGLFASFISYLALGVILCVACFQMYFGCALARYYIAFNFLGLCCVTGMSYIFKKSILDQLNGLGWYGKFLAEDYFLTKAMHEK
jgi:hypothetical protein